MREELLGATTPDGNEVSLPLTWVHTLVIGSGAAGLNAAVQLRGGGVEDVLIVSEGLQMGTSINTGSDKQTYYKLSLCGDEADAPGIMARTYFDGGGMHGDLALVEAALSVRGFINLVNLGVPFPRDEYGQFIGYKTDHDPRQRATSIGTYTAREMCRALIRQVQRLEIPIWEDRNVVQLLCVDEGNTKRATGAVVVRADGSLELIAAENVVFATGGPGGLYKTSVYPAVHTGGIGLALMIGAVAQNLPESQYGMASIKFRWNVSGTYMQVVPRFISTNADGTTDAREFLPNYFDTTGEMCSSVFLKGYQWPFDSRKVVGGSSIVDILVYIETVLKGRRVFLDFRRNPEGFRFEDLSDEAHEYLGKSEALLPTLIERLRKMSPAAIELYAQHEIDIAAEPLEIAVCAQHNNGGLAGNLWWESVNVKHLFPVGEVNGSHGVYRPGGSALNSGQVGSLRAAEFIAARYAQWTVDERSVKTSAAEAAAEVLAWIDKSAGAKNTWQTDRDEFQQRMTRAGAHIRKDDELDTAVAEAWRQVERIETVGCRHAGPNDVAEALRNRYLCLAHAVYLEAVMFAVNSGVGSRGSAMVVDPAGQPVHRTLSDDWRIAPENTEFSCQVPGADVQAEGSVASRWKKRFCPGRQISRKCYFSLLLTEYIQLPERILRQS